MVVVQTQREGRHGRYGGREWFNGETGPFFDFQEARSLCLQNGGRVIPFSESKMAEAMVDDMEAYVQKLKEGIEEKSESFNDLELEEGDEDKSDEGKSDEGKSDEGKSDEGKSEAKPKPKAKTQTKKASTKKSE